jgi:hypothetical protein
MCLSCYDKYSAIIFTTGRLPDVNPLLKLEWVLTTAKQPGPTALRAFRSTEELEIINFDLPSYD